MNDINITAKLFLLLGSANAMLAVIFGSFGAHALKARLDEHLLKVYHTGVEYHFYHALGLILIGIIAINIPINLWIKNAGWMMFSGIILFSGSLYLLSILNIRWLGMITPLGGLLFILSWLCLCIAIFKT
ncbi:MAG: DUF423 domain-containing protein [Proteobacteria bacterium]|nr:DUF423 domain-containing protein [Pseudomonadota bacterium]NOG59646.1 DUF423 domain-containing protein [Pseudomonadota bacterium]